MKNETENMGALSFSELVSEVANAITFGRNFCFCNFIFDIDLYLTLTSNPNPDPNLNPFLVYSIFHFYDF